MKSEIARLERKIRDQDHEIQKLQDLCGRVVDELIACKHGINQLNSEDQKAFKFFKSEISD